MYCHKESIGLTRYHRAMCGTECLRFISTPDVIIEEAPWGKHEWFVQSPLTKSEHLMMVKVTMGPGQAHRFHYHRSELNRFQVPG